MARHQAVVTPQPVPLLAPGECEATPRGAGARSTSSCPEVAPSTVAKSAAQIARHRTTADRRAPAAPDRRVGVRSRPSSASSAPPCMTSTTNGKPATAATSPTPPWTLLRKGMVHCEPLVRHASSQPKISAAFQVSPYSTMCAILPSRQVKTQQYSLSYCLPSRVVADTAC
jgi:hypothetical protein